MAAATSSVSSLLEANSFLLACEPPDLRALLEQQQLVRR